MDNEIIQSLSDNIKLLEKSVDQLKELVQTKEEELKQEHQNAVDDIKNLIAEQTDDISIEVRDKFNILTGALDEKKDQIKAFQETEKQVILAQIQKKIEKRKLLSKTLKLYGEIGNNNDLVVEEKEEVKQEAPKPIIEDVYKLDTPVEDTINNVVNEPVVAPRIQEESNIVQFTPSIEEEKAPMVKVA